MPTYVTLMNLTKKGLEDIKNAPERVAQTEKVLEQMGSKLLAFYMVMGEYDYVAISEGPSDEVAMTVLMMLGLQGNVRTVTMKAFRLEEMAAIINKLP